MSAPPSPSATPRLVSLDALRGFDMIWILGADTLVVTAIKLSHWTPLRFVAEQLDHKPWAGFTFYDLIFPLFVFIVGITTVFSLSSLIAREGRAAASRVILRRGALLFLLGIFHNGGLVEPWPHVRITGVLQRIALVYVAAGLLYTFCRTRTLAIATVALLAGYWALLTFVPVRDLPLDDAALAARLGVDRPTSAQVHTLFDSTSARVTGRFDPGANLPNHIDFQYLPGALYSRYYDPEGLLSTLPAIATCLLGVFAGLVLRRQDFDDRRKLQVFFLAGLGMIAAGWLWHLQFPVIKKIWTSSYVLVAGGWSLLLLAAFYYVVDVRRWRRGVQPFVWVGMNPITLYIIADVVNFHGVATRLAGGSVQAWFDATLAHGAGEFVVTLTGVLLVFALAGFLYQRKIFLRV